MAAGGAQFGWAGNHAKIVENGKGLALWPWGYKPAFDFMAKVTDQGLDASLIAFTTTLATFVTMVYEALKDPNFRSLDDRGADMKS